MKLETRVRTLPLSAALATALLGTACFTPADFGSGVAAEGHGAAEGHDPEGPQSNPEAEHAPEHATEDHAEIAAGEPAETIIEGIQPGTEGETLEIEVPEIPYSPPFDGKPLSSKTLDNGVVLEEFALGQGQSVANNTLVAFNFKGFASSSARQVMGSRATPSKLVINAASREQDPIASAMADALTGMKPGGKRRIKIPADIVEEGAPPGRPTVGDLWMTVELVSVEPAPVLEGAEAYAGDPVDTQTLDNGLVITDYTAGEGPAAEPGDQVTVHYIGQLQDGTTFDTSHSRAEGLPVVAGGGGVIKGFSQGVIGAKTGMLRKVVIPPELGYGEVDKGKIPPNSTLTFFLQVMEVKEGTGPQQAVNIPRRGDPQPAKPRPAKPKPAPKPTPDDGEE